MRYSSNSDILPPSDRASITAPYQFKYLEWVLIAGLLLILFAPMMGKMAGWPPENDLKENRYLAQLPDMHRTAPDKIPHAVDQWWNDRFAFRTQLIPLREKIWLDLLHAPGKQYIRGKNGQLFLNPIPGEKFYGSQNATVLDYLGANQLTAQQFSDWTDYLEGKSAWLQAYGIHYLFVVTPNKITVEDRFLPDRIRAAKGKSYLEQLREKVFPRLTRNVDLLDLTPLLIQKELQTGIPIFSRADNVAHWNGAGYHEGLLAMDRHLRRFFPEMAPFPDTQFELTRSDKDPTIFNCQWRNDDTVHAADESIIKFRKGDWEDPKDSTAEKRNGDLVLFSDSSWKALCWGMKIFYPGGHTAFPYQWGKHRHASIYHVTFDELQQIVKKEHPDVIIEAQTERALVIPPEIGIPPQFRLAARFSRGNTLFSLTHKGSAINSAAGFDAKRHTGSGPADRSSGNDSTIEAVKTLTVPRGTKTTLLMDMDTATAAMLRISWSTNRTFTADKSISTSLEMGRNVLFMPLPLPEEEAMHIQLNFANTGGSYQIRRFEIRSTPSK